MELLYLQSLGVYPLRVAFSFVDELQMSSTDDLPTGRIPCKGCQSLRTKRKQQRWTAFSGALLFTQRECCTLLATNQLTVVVRNTLLLYLYLLQPQLPSYPTSTQSFVDVLSKIAVKANIFETMKLKHSSNNRLVLVVWISSPQFQPSCVN